VLSFELGVEGVQQEGVEFVSEAGSPMGLAALPGFCNVLSHLMGRYAADLLVGIVLLALQSHCS
jgi:hypothetical protein